MSIHQKNTEDVSRFYASGGNSGLPSAGLQARERHFPAAGGPCQRRGLAATETCPAQRVSPRLPGLWRTMVVRAILREPPGSASGAPGRPGRPLPLAPPGLTWTKAMGVVVPSMSSRMARTSAGTGSTPMAAAARGAHRGSAAAAAAGAPPCGGAGGWAEPCTRGSRR